MTMAARDPAGEALRRRYAAARSRRAAWEGLWRDCYAFALPQRGLGDDLPAGRRGEMLYDGTAPDAVEQLAASLLAELAPPFSQWIGFVPGMAVPEAERAALAPLLDRAAVRLHQAFDRSNLAVELHQGFLDLAVGGTACLMIEEAPPGEEAALRFAAVPLAHAVLAESGDLRLDTLYRRAAIAPSVLRRRFPGARLPPAGEESGDARLPVIEAFEPEGGVWRYTLLLDGEEAAVLAEGRFPQAPFVAFRWLKAPGEIYGRSPVMTALPDIKTANKVVELVLKNASFAVAGMWQADDDGVLNPATVRIEPGTILPKAVGSAGLTPIQAPGKFDVSDLVLKDLRARIRHTLLTDRLGPTDAPRMTATEVLERSAETARLLGATYGRLQGELLAPLVRRSYAILARRGEVPDLPLDGRTVALDYRSPVARAQGQRDLRAVLLWLDAVGGLGGPATAAIDGPAAARWLGERLGVPHNLFAATTAAHPSQPQTEEIS
jgi:hypothetical protein